MIEVTFYRPPNGEAHTIEFENIHPTDEQWFRENNIDLSAEPQPNTNDNKIVLYAKVGDKNYEEVLVLADMDKETAESAMNRRSTRSRTAEAKTIERSYDRHIRTRFAPGFLFA